ncbi:MAG: di-trans,poly-cis-decaprenylcistransferase, partial [Alphaproteobacteria bacterium]|nr:di-trans,poly-cis-decaprenylcistransferase [Alphaproteobacteria bacterium]
MSFKNEIDKKKLPVHVAVIMDGNGRWAKKQGYLRTLGHEKGVDAVRNTVEAAAEIGIRYLTLYAFSTENWNRPKYEVDALMRILVKSLHGEMKTLMKNNIRLLAIGDLKSLPPKSYQELMKSIDLTSRNTGLSLILALSYSSRWELVEVARTIARQVEAGFLKP